MSWIKKLKWNEAFHECPMLQVGATGINRTKPTNHNQPQTWFVYIFLFYVSKDPMFRIVIEHYLCYYYDNLRYIISKQMNESRLMLFLKWIVNLWIRQYMTSIHSLKRLWPCRIFSHLHYRRKFRSEVSRMELVYRLPDIIPIFAVNQ
jgi:hypothetical protein